MTNLRNAFKKIFYLVSLSCCTVLTANNAALEGSSAGKGMEINSPKDMKLFLENAFHDTIESMDVKEEIYARYFSKDYVQYVDGKSLDYNDFVAHMKEQKKALKSAKVTIEHLVIENNKIATVHIVEAVKKDGHVVKMQVNSFFEVKDNKFIVCDELTHLIKGEPADRDLGSRKS